MPSHLFTHYFLTDGIKATAEWQSSVADPEAFAAFGDGVRQRYDALSRSTDPNEAVTEQELIRPILELLGWADYLPQQGTARKEDIPDHLLFADADSKQRAAARKAGDRFRYAAVVEESKRFGLPLDDRDKDDKVQPGNPHGQILRYLSTADIESDSRIRWGILTNGRIWRLYDHRARPRASGYFEADLEELFKPGKEDDLRVFHLLFHRESFARQQGATTTFLETALAEGRRYEEGVAQDLSEVVFERVFPDFVASLAEASEACLPEVRQAALIFLYRLLFVLYAEDRGLLPVNESRYDDYGLRKRVRDDIAGRMEDEDTYSAIATNYYDRLINLFKMIDKGDPSIGLPPYNGGLFASEAAPLLESVRLADAKIAPIIYDLSHARDPQGARRFVNYRDMSVQQLGSIYERLLEREPVRDDDGKIAIRPNPYARKDSGSFYTPQELVDLIVDRTLKPLVKTLFQQPANAYKLLARGPEHMDDDAPKPGDADWTTFCKQWDEARAIAEREGFLHWEVAFPGVWHDWQKKRPQGGFDAIIGNPPWDRIKLQEVEWFATRDPELAHAPTAAARRTGIQRLRDRGSPLAAEFDAARARSESLSRMVRSGGDYPLLGGGDVNLYSLFVERAMSLIKPDGFIGLLTPSGIYADKTAARFFKSISTSGRVGGLFDFENKKIFFKDVHASFKFCALIFGGEERLFDQTQCAFFLHDTETIQDKDRCFPLTPADFTRVNPNTGTAPVFRSRRDADITRRIYERHPVLVDRSGGEERRAWPIRYNTMFHMANDSHLFRTSEQLEAEGFYPVEGNRWKKGEELYLPLYEGKMVQAFDHRAADTTVNQQNLFRPGQQETIPTSEKQNFGRLPIPRYFVQVDENRWVSNNDWTITFKNVTASTNMRTMIAAVIPRVGAGHSLNLLPPISDGVDNSPLLGCLIVANLNAIMFDFVSRQKVPGNNFTWYLLEQLPVIASADYDCPFGTTTARDLVRDHVLRLTYTAHDMAPFARDLGYDGPPFIWNEEERRHLRARLDALYFHLYGLNRDDAGYVLGTFPIVCREDKAAFGRYRTRDLILAYMNALKAGDTETVVV